MAYPPLSTKEQKDIVRLLDKWIGKITWKKIEERIGASLNIVRSRQSLSEYPSIASAYERAKKRNRAKGISLQELTIHTKSDVDLIERNMQLKAEIESLSRKVDEQLVFIKTIFSEAGRTPSLMMLLQDMKQKLTNRQKK